MPEGRDEGLVEVAVAAPVRTVFTYEVPPALRGRLEPGHLVEVPFGRTTRRGVVLETSGGPDESGRELKPVRALVEDRPVCSDAMLRTLRWAADYYLTPPGEMVFAALPPPFRKRGASIRPRRQVRVVPAASADPDRADALGRRAPLQARILRAVLRDGGQEPAVLARLGGGGRQALRGLVDKGLVRLEETVDAERGIRRVPVGVPVPPPVERLTRDQEAALGEVVGALDAGRYAAFLLHGVTGSGKTEVYLRAIARSLESGRGAILLVPEISLTPQLLARVAARFGDQVAVLHSGLRDTERLDAWHRLSRGQARVAVGARSAVFAPVPAPGLVVVDEEHDSSYKQSERLTYNGRDLALVRAREEGAVVLLGTATPSVEAYAHARNGRSRLLELGERIQQRALPEVEVVDLKTDLVDPVERGHTLSTVLAERLAETLDRGEQAIMFLNRRGYASFALCKDCGRSVQCANCSVALVHHLGDKSLRCHYCGLRTEIPRTCAHCGGGRVQLLGLGTEKCEQEIRRRFPGARVLRLDSDSAQRRGALVSMMERFSSGEADVLVGTQMVTKGHDVPGVTLVGVLLADQSLQFPDFRATERTFQLLVQVAGRAGRGTRPGRVVIQTFMPDHEIIGLAREDRFAAFYAREYQRREQLGYPPCRRLLLVRISHPDQEVAAGVARSAGRAIQAVRGRGVDLLGPVPSPLARLRGRWRWQMLVKSGSVAGLHGAAQAVLRLAKVPGETKILFDVDPVDML